MEVEATGQGIAVPVGEKTLGRLFNVLGDTLDGGESLEGAEKWVIHRGKGFAGMGESGSKSMCRLF